jgi:hypothetical protein
MRPLALALLLTIAVPCDAAQPTTAIPLATARLTWTYADTEGAEATQLRVKCGRTPGAYTAITTLTDTSTRTLPVRQAVPGPGSWYCVVTAANAIGESTPSNEVFFSAATAPFGPIDLGVNKE